MSLTVTCPDCDKKLKVKDEAAGKKIRCPACSTVFPIPATSDDDDFLDDQDGPPPTKRKRREIEEDFDDELPATKARSAKLGKPTKKKSGRGKSSGTNWLLIGGIAGGGLVLVLFAVILVAAIGQARKAASNRAGQLANWPTFHHPMGLAQIDMPGVPTLNTKQSVNGSQTYSLLQRNYQMSLTAVALPDLAQQAINNNSAMVDLMFKEMETKTPQQMPGSRLIASRRLTDGPVPGLELKIDIQGNINLMRFYLFPNTLLGAEFITKNETTYAADRERFFNSFRGPDGNLINGPVQPPRVPVTGNPVSTTVTTEPANSARSLTEARRALQTKLIRQEKSGQPAPHPPAAARLVRYDAPGGQLAAYVTKIPKDGKKHPAIVWVSGGDCNSIDIGFFKNSSPANDQTAMAFRQMRIVTMYPSLRGGNDNPGFKEGFLGEVDDVLAAADFLSKQDGIDPDRIYLGGHSTGGTVALLAAESDNRFRAIFSFGPVDDIRGYGAEFIMFDSRNAAELEPRTPSRWLGSIQNPTFVLEGMQEPGNLQSLRVMSQASRNEKVTFLAVPKANHFNILAPATRLIAEKILGDNGPTSNITLTESELNLNYAQ